MISGRWLLIAPEKLRELYLSLRLPPPRKD